MPLYAYKKMRVKSQMSYYYDRSIFLSSDHERHIICEPHFGRGSSEIWRSTEKWVEENGVLEGD